MKFHTYSYLMAAACLCTSAGLAVSPVLGADTHAPAGQPGWVTPSHDTTGNAPQFPAGITPKQMDEKNSIQNAFESVTESAFSKNGFDDVLDNLADQDRTRLQHEKQGASHESTDALAQKMGQLKEAWKTRYNKDFDIKNENAYDGFLSFQTGEIADPSQLVGKWPAQAANIANQTSTGGEASAQDVNDAKSHNFGGDVNLEKGRDVALVRVPGSNGAPELTASMIHEAGGWKFDIPNTITRQQLHQTLLNNLSHLYDHQNQWPSDTKQACQEATQYVVASLYNIDLSQAGRQALNNVTNTLNPTANNR
jgi:hypothetical protein